MATAVCTVTSKHSEHARRTLVSRCVARVVFFVFFNKVINENNLRTLTRQQEGAPRLSGSASRAGITCLYGCVFIGSSDRYQHMAPLS